MTLVRTVLFKTKAGDEHLFSRGIFLKKANHYDNFDCYALGMAKPVVVTSKNLKEPDYDVIKMAAILNVNENISNS